jgi:HAD superfamily hydrolase (TIGR01509 family)
MKKFLLFDNDGVLVETEPLYFKANEKILKDELGLVLNLDEYLKIMARGGTSWEIAHQNNIPQDIINQCRIKRDALYQHYLQHENIEIPNVKIILKELSKRFKMGIVTTSRREDFNLIHHNRGIVDFMDFTLCVEEYTHAKPHPEPYLKGLKKFNAHPNEALVIEDSQRGLISAYEAKIECAIVKNEFTQSHDFSKATYFIDSLEELAILL